MTWPPSNPFSTRHVRPGAIDFILPAGESLRQVVSRLRAAYWQAQIIGPHGSGKTTLVCTLIKELNRIGRHPHVITLHAGQRRLPEVSSSFDPRDCQSLLIIDGFEQLAPFLRWRIKRRYRRYPSGLLVTSHRDVGLTTIFETSPSVAVMRQIVDQLQSDHPHLIDEPDITRCLEQSQGDMREALFGMYDLYELRRRRRANSKNTESG